MDVELGESLDISRVQAARDSWREALASGARVIRVEVSQLKTIDTAGLQLLISLRRSMARTGGHVVFVGNSEALRRAAEVVGLSYVLFDERPCPGPEPVGPYAA